MTSKLIRSSIFLLLWAVLPVAAHSQENPFGLAMHHMTASVADIDRAVKWYEDILGFKVANRGNRDNGAFLFAEMEIPGFGVVVSLVQVAGLPQTPPAAPTANRSPRWVHIVFSAPDPDRMFKELKQRGVNVSTRANAPAGPVVNFLIHDSEGNEIEIAKAAPRPGVP